MLSFLKRIAFIYLKIGGPKYDFNVEPILLATIINELERLKTVKGNILEIGVDTGQTFIPLASNLSRSHNNLNFMAHIDAMQNNSTQIINKITR